MLVNFSFRSSFSFDLVLAFVLVFLVVFWKDLVIFLLLFLFYSLLLLFCLWIPGRRRYFMKYQDWPSYWWQPHKFCNSLCFML